MPGGLAAAGGLRGARFVDPKVLARIGNLELVARTVVDGVINGLHRAPYLGLSLDFAEHRGYEPGDDIRRIDWRVFGRTDRFYVKQFEADSNANFTLLLDVSRSMSFTSGGLSKLDYARYLAASLTYLAHRQRDRVGLTTFDAAPVERIPPAAGHFEIVLHALDRAAARGPGGLVGPLSSMTEHSKRRGFVTLISDLYDEPQAIADAVKRFRYQGNEVIVFHVLDPAEIEFPYDDASSFMDLETGARLPVVPDALAARYRELVREHSESLGRLLSAHRIDYALFDTRTPLDHALFRFLATRARLTRVR
jgi:uncharacterized protein (DUF58 family)